MSYRLTMARNAFNARRADFYYDLAMALEDQSDLVTEITDLRSLAEERKQLGNLELYNGWIRNLDSGLLTDALKDDIPRTELMILNAFETAGRLTEGLKFLSKTVKVAGRMNKSIKLAVVVPSFVILMIFLILALHAFMLTPVLEQIYPVAEWPLPGRMLHPVAMFIRSYGIYVIGFVIAAVIMFKMTLTRWSGPRRRKFDEYLPYRLFRDYNGALFLTSLSAMMKANTGVVAALNTLKSMSTPWMKWHIQRMISGMDLKASDPAEALDTGALPRDIMDRIISYGRRSSFLDAMSMIGLDSMERTEVKIADSSRTLNTVLIVIAGLMFILIILGTVTTGMHAQDVLRAKMM